MQTTVNYQYVPNNQNPFKYVLPPNLNEKYQQFSSDKRDIMKQTERCPFPQIRNLIITFKNKQPLKTDPEMPDLLRQKYCIEPELAKQDADLSRSIQEAEQMLIELDELKICTDRYNELYDKATQSLDTEYQKQMKDLKNQVSKNEASNNQLAESLNFDQSSSMQMTIEQKMKHDEAVRQMKNKKAKQIAQNKLQMYDKNKNKYNETNKFVLDIENDYFTYFNYSQEFERALIIVSSTLANTAADKSSANLQASYQLDNTLKLKTTINDLRSSTKSYLNTSMKELFKRREKVKCNDKSNMDSHEFEGLANEWNQLYEKIRNLLTSVSKLSQSLKYDREKTRSIFERVTSEYQHFLPNYIRAREVYEISSKSSYYQEIISDEKRRFENHLRRNYGMIVPYSVSDEFNRLITPLQQGDKRYLRQLFAPELEPLEFGIDYTNREYEKLYKEACDATGVSRVREKIQNNLMKFQGFAEDPANNFAIHLIESCRKLLRIAK